MGRKRIIDLPPPDLRPAEVPPANLDRFDAAAKQVEFAIRADSEKARLDRRQRRERTASRLCSGVYKTRHENGRHLIPYVPPVWLRGMMEDWVVTDGLRGLTLKVRQIFNTTFCGFILTDYAFKNPGTACLLHSITQPESNYAMLTKCTEPFQFCYPALAEDRSRVMISTEKILFKHPASIGGDSTIRSGDWTGRGQTFSQALATEFPVLCAQDPVKAEKYFSAAVNGPQFCAHFLEGTASEASPGDLMSNLMSTAVDRQRLGIKPTRLDWVGYFVGWYQKPENSIGDADWDEREKIPAHYLRYFAKLTDKRTEYMVGRHVRTGGIPLTEGQKRWYYKMCENSAHGDMEVMKGNFPSLLSESMSAGSQGFYLRESIAAARRDGRIGAVPVLAGRVVHVAFDIGFNDATAVVWAQRGLDGKHWNVLGSAEFVHWKTPALLEWIGKMDFDKMGGTPAMYWLPHDGKNKTQANDRMTGRMGRTVFDDFMDAELEVDCAPKPAKEEQIFGRMREVMGMLNFDEEQCRELLQALGKARIQQIIKDKSLSKNLHRNTSKHLHDSLAVLAWVILEETSRENSGFSAADISAMYRQKAGDAPGEVSFGN